MARSRASSEIVRFEMKDEGPSRNPGVLESLGSTVFSLARYAVEKLEKFPNPIGSSVSLVEELVSPKMVSASALVENLTLQALAYADDEMEWLVSTVDKCFQLLKEMADASKHVFTRMVSATRDKVKGNSLVDYAANLLVNYEIIVKNRTDSVLHLVLSFSGLGFLDNRAFAVVPEKPPVILIEGENMVEAPSKTRSIAASNRLVQEISPAKPNIDKKRRFDLAKVVASFNNEGDDETDELSKLIDASWCLGSPRHM